MSSPEARYGGASDFQNATPGAAPLQACAVNARRVAFRRLALLLACGGATGAVLLLGGGGVRSADPDLETLLKGMAIIKSAILSAAAAAVWWRLGSSVGSGLVAGYIVSVALAACGAALVWTMTGLAFAPFLFDGGLLLFLVLALRDDGGPRFRALFRAATQSRDTNV
jgi:hypothetical protein